MKEIKLLLLEDSAEDSELIMATLNRGQLIFKVDIVSTKEDFIQGLNCFSPDIILSDHNLPQFSSTEALQIARGTLPFIPFILVTGTVSDEFATSIIHSGADDYVLKGNLKRLPIAITQAITKKQTERSQAILVSIVNSTDDAIISKSMDGFITSWNNGAEKLFGYSQKDAIGMNVAELIPFNRSNEEKDIMMKISQGEFITHYETQFQKQNGDMTHISLTVSPIKDALGNIIGASKIARDITLRIEAEKQKEFDTNNLAALINNTNDLMWSVDKDLKLITFNDAFGKMVKLLSGRPAKKGYDVLSMPLTEKQLKRNKSYYERALSGDTFTITEHSNTPVESWSEISFHPIRQAGYIIGTACFSIDITKSKLAEQERIKITNNLILRNKDLEQFTYIVSHNLRAPVANILGAATGLDYPGLTQAKNGLLVRGLMVSATKLDDVIKDLNHILQVKGEVKEIKENVCFSSLVNDIRISIENLNKLADITIEYDFTESDEFLSLKSYLYSIFYNLITNSIKYRQPKGPCLIHIKSHLLKDSLELIFTDNGRGIDLDSRSGQVFGLYKRFHTNTEGKGLGLFMVKAMVETLGGVIRIESEVNKGSVFRIELEK